MRLYLPAVTGAATTRVEPVASPVRGGTETILLVEDDEQVQRAATRVLEQAGYTVVRASDGIDALEILDNGAAAPDLIISDVVMPRLSGPDLLSKLRAAGPVPRMLFISGHTTRDTAHSTQLDPSLPLLAKPWSVNDLLRSVRGVLDAPPAV